MTVNKANTVVSLNERRKHPRVSDALSLRLNVDGSNLRTALDSQPTHIVKLSCGGLRFQHHSSLDENSELLISMHLPSISKTVHIDSRVISSGEEKTKAHHPSKTYFVQVEFQKMDDQVVAMLKEHINYVLAKTSTFTSPRSYSA